MINDISTKFISLISNYFFLEFLIKGDYGRTTGYGFTIKGGCSIVNLLTIADYLLLGIFLLLFGYLVQQQHPIS